MSTVLQDADRKLLGCCCKAHVECRPGSAGRLQCCSGRTVIVSSSLPLETLEVRREEALSLLEPVSCSRGCAPTLTSLKVLKLKTAPQT
jgi:hypothetical protein